MTDGTGPRKGLEAVRRHKAEWDRDGASLDDYADASDRFESTETEPGLIRWTIQKNTGLAWLVALLWLLGAALKVAGLIDPLQNPDTLTSIYLAVVNLALVFFAVNLLATVLLYTEREELDRPVVTDGGRIVTYHCEECGHVPDPDLGDHGQPTCPDCGRTVEQVATDGGEPLELENEGEIIENPRFVCERCGFANVELIDAPLPAAKCTNCGVGYFERKVATDGGRATVAQLREEIRGLLEIPDWERGESSFRARELAKAAVLIGAEEHAVGSGPMLRKSIRQELEGRRADEEFVDGRVSDPKPLRRDELEQLRDVIQEEGSGGEAAAVVPDGGSKYVNPTGEGYLGVGKVSSGGVGFGVGMFPVDWDGDTTVWAVEESPGVAIVDEEPGDAIAPYQVSKGWRNSPGPALSIGGRGLRPLDVDDGDDVRAYERDGGGLLLVTTDPDPMLATDGGKAECGRRTCDRDAAVTWTNRRGAIRTRCEVHALADGVDGIGETRAEAIVNEVSLERLVVLCEGSDGVHAPPTLSRINRLGPTTAATIAKGVDESRVADALRETSEEPDVATDGGVPVMNGDVVGAEQHDDGTIVATVEFDTGEMPEDLPVMEWLLTGEASLSISSQDGQGPLVPDGGQQPPADRLRDAAAEIEAVGEEMHSRSDGASRCFELCRDLATTTRKVALLVESRARDGSKYRVDGDPLTDGGHPPGPSASGVHPDAVFMGEYRHFCEVCSTEFDSLPELSRHDCEIYDVDVSSGGDPDA